VGELDGDIDGSGVAVSTGEAEGDEEVGAGFGLEAAGVADVAEDDAAGWSAPEPQAARSSATATAAPASRTRTSTPDPRGRPGAALPIITSGGHLPATPGRRVGDGHPLGGRRAAAPVQELGVGRVTWDTCRLPANDVGNADGDRARCAVESEGGGWPWRSS